MLRDASRLLLLPGERVVIPFKFQSWRAALPGAVAGAGAGMVGLGWGSAAQTAAAEGDASLPLAARTAMVAVRNADGVAVLTIKVRVRPQPVAVTNTFRFFAPEHEMLKAKLEVGPGGGARVAGVDGGIDSHAHTATFWAAEKTHAISRDAARGRRWARASRADVLVGSHDSPDHAGQAPALFFKYRCGPAPSVRSFLVAAYADEFLTALVGVYEVWVHSLVRLDVHAFLGERSRSSVLLKLPEAITSARCVRASSAAPGSRVCSLAHCPRPRSKLPAPWSL